MSKQLAISASASIFAMAAFVLFATSPGGQTGSHGLQSEGATIEIAAPSFDRLSAILFD